MADQVVALEATNLYSLGATFHAQSSNSPHGLSSANMLDAAGNNECETMVDGKTDFSADYAYCKATPTLKADLGAFLTAFGTVANSKLPTSLTVNYTAGEYATLSIDGHNHDDNEHTAALSGVSDVSGAFLAGTGFGVPAYGLTGTGMTPISATVSISLNHIDENDADGAHWTGTNTTFRAELSIETLGLPTQLTPATIEAVMTGWTVDTNGASDGNQEFDRYQITAHRFFDKT